MKCPNCQKVVKQTPGKREKVFCNSTCRSNYWAKEKRKADSKAPKGIKLPKDYVNMSKGIKVIDKNGIITPIFNKMPKGLSLAQQIDWKIKNGK